jgi:hypothetical protein
MGTHVGVWQDLASGTPVSNPSVLVLRSAGATMPPSPPLWIAVRIRTSGGERERADREWVQLPQTMSFPKSNYFLRPQASCAVMPIVSSPSLSV